MCENQEIYNNWIRNTPASAQDRLCGGNLISHNELYFINQYAQSMNLDIGCGTGNRTFNQWIRKGVDFLGIEKYQKLIDASHSPEKVVLADVSEVSFSDALKPKLDSLDKKPVNAFLFGGVINGILCRENQENTWKNFSFLFQYCEYILVDTLTHFPWFDDADTGRVEQVFPFVPPQYFYSSKEINRLNGLHNISIHEEITEHLPGGLSRAHYLLKRG
jgi:hypothetical protein